MKKIKWLQLALTDLEEILAFIADDDPSAAVKIAARIHQCVALLSDQPGMGRPGRVPETRELVISGTPFIVPYRVVADEIQILRVIHGSRKFPGKIT